MKYTVYMQFCTQRDTYRVIVDVKAEDKLRAMYMAMGYIMCNEKNGKGRYLKFDSVYCEEVKDEKDV